jgi:hypothetical protein
METKTGVGIFLIITGVVILVPVHLQLRDGRYQWREVRGILRWWMMAFLTRSHGRLEQMYELDQSAWSQSGQPEPQRR